MAKPEEKRVSISEISYHVYFYHVLVLLKLKVGSCSYHKEQNKWIYEAFENTDDITLHSLGVHFSLADAYIDVEFEETTADTNL